MPSNDNGGKISAFSSPTSKKQADISEHIKDKMTDIVGQSAERIRKSTNILVALSNDPNIDEISAALAMTMILNQLGKHVTAIYSGKTPNALQFLRPDETFEKDTNSLQDFIIILNKDKADHLRYKIEGDFVKVYITPYRTEITSKDIQFDKGDYNVDLVIAIDVESGDVLDAALENYGRIMHDATAINITNNAPGRFAEIEWSDPSVSSVCEMIANLAKQLGITTFSTEIATALLTGIVSATEHFSNAKTTSDTMKLASELMNAGADQQLISSNIENAEKAEENADQPAETAPEETPAETAPEETPAKTDSEEKSADNAAENKPVEAASENPENKSADSKSAEVPAEDPVAAAKNASKQALEAVGIKEEEKKDEEVKDIFDQPADAAPLNTPAPAAAEAIAPAAAALTVAPAPAQTSAPASPAAPEPSVPGPAAPEPAAEPVGMAQAVEIPVQPAEQPELPTDNMPVASNPTPVAPAAASAPQTAPAQSTPETNMSQPTAPQPQISQPAPQATQPALQMAQPVSQTQPMQPASNTPLPGQASRDDIQAAMNAILDPGFTQTTQTDAAAQLEQMVAAPMAGLNAANMNAAATGMNPALQNELAGQSVSLPQIDAHGGTIAQNVAEPVAPQQDLSQMMDALISDPQSRQVTTGPIGSADNSLVPPAPPMPVAQTLTPGQNPAAMAAPNVTGPVDAPITVTNAPVNISAPVQAPAAPASIAVPPQVSQMPMSSNMNANPLTAQPMMAAPVAPAAQPAAPVVPPAPAAMTVPAAAAEIPATPTPAMTTAPVAPVFPPMPDLGTAPTPTPAIDFGAMPPTDPAVPAPAAPAPSPVVLDPAAAPGQVQSPVMPTQAPAVSVQSAPAAPAPTQNPSVPVQTPVAPAQTPAAPAQTPAAPNPDPAAFHIPGM